MKEYIKRAHVLKSMNALYERHLTMRNYSADGATLDCMSIVTNAPAADVVSKDLYEQIKWERDAALAQLKDYGVSLGEKADVVEVRHAKWVSLTPPLLLEEFREMEADIFFMCSECKDECKLVEQDDYYDYCPRCGCKMDKEE